MNKISYSSCKKRINQKKRDLSTWIKDYELQAYSTKDMKEEIKELLLNTYNKDEDIREHFFKKYISGFSEILDEQSTPRKIESIFKDISFDLPEKNEFKIFIENKNKILENKKKHYKYYKIYKNNWSLNKQFENNINNDKNIDYYDLEDEDELNKKNDYKNNKILSIKKIDNSKVRNYVKFRNQMLKRNDNIFNGNEIKNNNNNIPTKNINKDNSEKEDTNLGKEKISHKKNSSIICFRHLNLNKNNNRDYYDIPRLNYKNKKNEKKDIKIYSKINIEDEEENILNNGSIYSKKKIINNISDILYEKKIVLINKGEPTKEDNSFKKIENLKELNDKDKKTVLNELFINDNLILIKKGNEYNFNEIKKNNKLKKFINDIIRDCKEMNDKKFRKLKERVRVHNGNELKEDDTKVKKLNINKIIGYPKKLEISEESIKDTNNLEISKNKNEESSLVYKRIIIKKNLDIKDIPVNGKIKSDKNNDQDISYEQKIEKDIKENKTYLRNINIPKDAFFKKNQGKNLKNSFDYNREMKQNKSYKIRNNKIIEINNFDEKTNDIKNKTQNNFDRNNYY